MASLVLPVVLLLQGSAFAALGILLLALRVQSRVNRAFAVYLLAQGSSNLLNGMLRLAGPPSPGFLSSALGSAELTVAPALAWALLAYLAPHGHAATRIAKVAVGLAAVALQALYLADGCLMSCAAPATRAGPLVLTSGLATILAAAFALFAALDLARKPDGPRANGNFLVALAFGFGTAFDAAAQLFKFLLRTPDTLVPAYVSGKSWALTAFALKAAAILPVLAALAVLLALGRRTPAWRPGAILACALFPVALAIGFYTEWGTGRLSGLSLDVQLASVGLVRIGVAGTLAYAVIRHRLFGSDPTARRVIRHSTVAAMFLGLILVVANIAQNFLGQMYGALFGGVATGLMLLALHPVQRVAERVAEAAVPPAILRPGLEVYRRQAALVWMDGRMGRKERLLLDHLRASLGIEAEAAAAIEHEAAAGLRPTRRP